LRNLLAHFFLQSGNVILQVEKYIEACLQERLENESAAVVEFMRGFQKRSFSILILFLP